MIIYRIHVYTVSYRGNSLRNAPALFKFKAEECHTTLLSNIFSGNVKFSGGFPFTIQTLRYAPIFIRIMALLLPSETRIKATDKVTLRLVTLKLQSKGSNYHWPTAFLHRNQKHPCNQSEP